MYKINTLISILGTLTNWPNLSLIDVFHYQKKPCSGLSHGKCEACKQSPNWTIDIMYFGSNHYSIICRYPKYYATHIQTVLCNNCCQIFDNSINKAQIVTLHLWKQLAQQIDVDISNNIMRLLTAKICP